MGWKDTAKGAMDAAASAAKSAANDARDKGDELMLKRKVDALAEELGHTVYRQHEGMGGLDEHVDELVAQMRALNAEIAAIKGPGS